jgi:hypothetical protein
MKALGVITAVISAAVAVLAAVTVVRSSPDVRRYLKMRSM